MYDHKDYPKFYFSRGLIYTNGKIIQAHYDYEWHHVKTLLSALRVCTLRMYGTFPEGP